MSIWKQNQLKEAKKDLKNACRMMGLEKNEIDCALNMERFLNTYQNLQEIQEKSKAPKYTLKMAITWMHNNKSPNPLTNLKESLNEYIEFVMEEKLPNLNDGKRNKLEQALRRIIDINHLLAEQD